VSEEFITKAEAERGRWFDAGRPLAQALLRTRAKRVLVDGPLGTGKTRLNLEKVRACCLKYAGCRWVLLRSVRKWLTHSALVTWEEKVLEPGVLIPDKVRPSNRSEYRFRNGSVVVVAGLDDPQSVFSAEYDGACLIEAIEIDQDTAEKVDGRLRYGRMPYQQFLMDCNPGPPTHWLHRAFETGWCERLPMRHTDNPALYLPDLQTRTRFGREYLGRLDDLTGVRRERLRDGRWVQAEGVVYEAWDAAVHLVEAFEIPAHWRRFWAIDFGFTNPLSWQFWAEDPDGRLHLHREIYQPGLLVADACSWVRKLTQGEPAPAVVITDHDPEAMAVVERSLGVRCTPAEKTDRSGGIQAVKDRLRRAGDGRPRLTISKTSLAHIPDESLRSAGKPTSTAAEFDGYVWNPRLARNEEPLKENDHGLDALRYLVGHLDSKPVVAADFYDEPPSRRDSPRFGW
jgi:hypothetical protein